MDKLNMSIRWNIKTVAVNRIYLRLNVDRMIFVTSLGMAVNFNFKSEMQH